LNRKPITKPTRSYKKPVKIRTEIKIPLKREEIDSTKQFYVKEVIVKKKPVRETGTGTGTGTGEVTSEEIAEE
jgi:stress response protein YsnF